MSDPRRSQMLAFEGCGGSKGREHESSGIFIAIEDGITYHWPKGFRGQDYNTNPLYQIRSDQELDSSKLSTTSKYLLVTRIDEHMNI